MTDHTMETPLPRDDDRRFRLSGRGALILLAIIAILALYATDQITPATSERQAELRIWLAARAAGIVSFLLLSLQICLGLILSHPTNKSTWKLRSGSSRGTSTCGSS